MDAKPLAAIITRRLLLVALAVFLLQLAYVTVELASRSDEIEQSELARYGIERVPADVFLWGGYRYSNARDAVAAAKRGAKES